jgi:lysophospholipase L1-like esterase
LKNLIKKKPGLTIFLILIVFFITIEFFIRVVEHFFPLSGKVLLYSPLGVNIDNIPNYTKDPYLFWRFKSNQEFFERDGVKIRINNIGLRGDDFFPQKEKDWNKILCLGDSCTFGLGIDYDKTYPYLLEQKLRQTNPDQKYRVINGGVPAYTSFQGLRYLQQNLDLISPKYVTLYFGNHEYVKTPVNEDIKQPAPKIAMINNFLGKSRIFIWLQRGMIFIQRKLFEREEKSYVFDITTGKKIETKGIKVRNRVKLEDYKILLEKIVTLLQSKGIIPIIILSPCQTDDPDHLQYINAAKEVITKHNLKSADIYAMFLPDRQRLMSDKIHPSVAGHELIADELYKIIVQTNK